MSKENNKNIKLRNLSPFMQAFNELPHTIPLLPLANAVIIPDAELPLNIFEPRYLNLIKDSLKKDRLVGMIQPKNRSSKPDLYAVGCAARINKYEETNDGRLEVSLIGLCRFEIKEHLPTVRGYDLIVPDWSKFESDYLQHSSIDNVTKLRFINSLRSHFTKNKMEVNWQVLEKLTPDKLFHSIFYLLELSDEEKQLLIEIDTLDERLKAFIAMFEEKGKVCFIPNSFS